MKIEIKSLSEWKLIVEIDSWENYRVDFLAEHKERISSLLMNRNEFKSLLRFFINTNIKSGSIYSTPETFICENTLCEISCTYQAKNELIFFTIYKFLEFEEEDCLNKIASFSILHTDLKQLEEVLK